MVLHCVLLRQRSQHVSRLGCVLVLLSTSPENNVLGAVRQPVLLLARAVGRAMTPGNQ